MGWVAGWLGGWWLVAGGWMAAGKDIGFDNRKNSFFGPPRFKALWRDTAGITRKNKGNGEPPDVKHSGGTRRESRGRTKATGTPQI